MSELSNCEYSSSELLRPCCDLQLSVMGKGTSDAHMRVRTLALLKEALCTDKGMVSVLDLIFVTCVLRNRLKCPFCVLTWC